MPRPKKQQLVQDSPVSTKRKAGESTKLKTKDIKDWIWQYFDDTIKIFIPKQFRSEFDLFMRENRSSIKLKQAAVYTISLSHASVKPNKKSYQYRQGRDYITDKKHKQKLKVWYKTIIKGT